MDRAQLVDEHPMLFHMAEDGTWPSIQRHGLLSTTALVNLYDPPPDVRRAILGAVRRSSFTLHHPEYGPAVVRDQAPLKFLDRCLSTGTTEQAFLDALNGRVFFWVREERLNRLLKARLYRNRVHTVLHVDTASLVADHGDVIELAPYNTGDVHVPGLPLRGPETFVQLDDYPHPHWRRKRGPRGDAVVELTVPHHVHDVERHVLRVERRHGDQVLDVLYTRA